ncbi:MAG: SRPBCC domain-containing protein [Candidatus Acidiferrales bacterium]
MAASKSTPDADALVSEIHVAAPPERVFQALVSPEQVPQWWGQRGVYRCTKFQSDLRVGGKWRSEGLGPDGGNFKIAGEYLEVDPPHLLAYTWIASWTGDVKTTVRWELEPTSNGTLVRIRHLGFAAHPEAAQNYKGWPSLLGFLQAFLERGETVDDRKPASPG